MLVKCTLIAFLTFLCFQVVTCGSVSLESSYEKASRCIYTSTVLYEYGGLGLKPIDGPRVRACFHWRLAYSEVCEFPAVPIEFSHSLCDCKNVRLTWDDN